MTRPLQICCACLMAILISPLAVAQPERDLPDYETSAVLAGTVSSVGSDTLANLMTLWAEAFRRLHPGVTVQVQAAGSSSAPPALVERTASFGPMSREMKDAEIQAFERRYGYPPTAIPVAIDALAIYVHKDNPLAGLTLADVDAIFSRTLRCGASAPVQFWGDLGLSGGWRSRSLQRFGRNAVSGTYGYFKDAALCAGDFLATVNEQPGSASVVQSVSTALNGIGYSGIGYRTASVRAVPLARLAGEPFQAATAENAVSGAYPLARFLYVYVNKAPGQPLPLLEQEFIRLMLSRTGQDLVLKDGYIPLPAAVVTTTLSALGLMGGTD